MRFWTIIGLITVLSALGLTYEIAAGRVLAPFFGASLVTWTTVIAVVLAGFAVGSALGGFIAERPRAEALRAVSMALVVTAILMALSPLVLNAVYAAGARGTGGMVLAVLVAFLPASVLVSLPSPLLANMAVEARPGREGSSLGMVLAAGSLGAIGGAVLAGFVALPTIGSTATFTGCGVLALACLLVLRRARGGGTATKGSDAPVAIWPAALVVASSLTLGPACRYESGLSCLDVAERGPTISLYSDRTRQAGERLGPVPADDGGGRLALPYTRWIWTQMDDRLGPDPAVLFVGGGGYSLPARLLESRPEARAVAVEIDPLVTQVVRARLPWAGGWLTREGAGPAFDDAGQRRLRVVHADGRVYLNETDRRFDAAVMDAFSSGSVPAHLVTRETYARLREIVDGPVYVNLLDRPDGPLARGVHAILTETYPHVEAVAGPPGSSGLSNVLLVGSDRPLPALADQEAGFKPVTIRAARAFTDDRGWVGHR